MKTAAKKAEGQQITYQCGHSQPLSKVVGKQCPMCRSNATAEKHKREREERQVKLKSKTPPAGKQHGRLPDTAEFRATYREAAEAWTGSLTISGCPMFEANASAVFKLLTDLDAQYRTWLGGQR